MIMTSRLKADMEKMIEYKMKGDWVSYQKLIDRMLAEMREFEYDEQA